MGFLNQTESSISWDRGGGVLSRLQRAHGIRPCARFFKFDISDGAENCSKKFYSFIEFNCKTLNKLSYFEINTYLVFKKLKIITLECFTIEIIATHIF